MAINSATREAAWIRKFLAEIGELLAKAIPIKVDNEAAIV